MKVVICIALEGESEGESEEISKKYENIEILYTGVGQINATYSLTKKIMEIRSSGQDIKAIINIGSAGGRNKMRIGDVVECNKFVLRTFDQSPLGYKMGQINPDSIFPDDRIVFLENELFFKNGEVKNGICGTGDTFETGIPKIKDIDIVEMEAAALAKVSIREKIRFIALKYISDDLGKSDEKWIENVEKTGKALGRYLDLILNKICN